MSQLIYLSESNAALRRVYLRLVLASDGQSPATSAAVTAGVCRLIANGVDTANSTNNITEVNASNAPGRWYIELTAAELSTLGVGNHHARFKEADTLESIGGDFQIAPDNMWVAGPTAASTAAAVWDAARSSHTTSGSFGQGVASVQGNVTGSVATVTAVSAGGITAASLASDTITAAKIASDAITAAKIASDAITAAKIANDAITAAKVATGAIDADAVAADAVNEIADGILDRTAGVETGLTLRVFFRRAAAVLFGKSTGSAASRQYRDMGDAKDRVDATIDGSLNRSAISYDDS